MSVSGHSLLRMASTGASSWLSNGFICLWKVGMAVGHIDTPSYSIWTCDKMMLMLMSDPYYSVQTCALADGDEYDSGEAPFRAVIR